MNKKIPTPISCDLYDHLEIWSMKKQTVLVRYAKEGRSETYEGRIINLMTKEKIEYLITEKKELIPLHLIVKIDDLIFNGHCEI